MGGMGIHDLHKHNIAMLLRWWWRAYTNATCIWTATVTILKWTGLYETGPNFWMVSSSFFWNALVRLLPIFRWSTKWEVGTGAAISFWYDAWHGNELITRLELGQKPTQPKISLKDAVPIVNLLLPGIQLNIRLQARTDVMLWRWTPTRNYTTSSVYKVLVTGGKINFDYAYVCRLPIPPTVRIFAYLMIKEKILTGEVMVRRRVGVHNTCLMCLNCPSESALHLLFLCPNAVRVWFEIGQHYGFRVMIPRQTIEEIIVRSRQQAEMEGERYRKLWDSLFMCTCWWIWKQRNNLSFSGILMPTTVVVNRIVEETRLWMSCCGPGRHRRDHQLIKEPD